MTDKTAVPEPTEPPWWLQVEDWAGAAELVEKALRALGVSP